MLRRLVFLLPLLGLAAVVCVLYANAPDSIDVGTDGVRSPGGASVDGGGATGPTLQPGEAEAGHGSRAGPQTARPMVPTRDSHATPTGPSTPVAPGVPEVAPPGAVGRFEILVRGPAGEQIAAAEANVIDAEGSRRVRVVNGRLAVWLRAADQPLQLQVFRARGADGSAAAWGWAIQRVESASAGRSIELRLPDELTLAGSVADASGLPVVGVEVEARAVLPDPLGRGGDRGELSSETVTDSSGRFVLRRLGAGEVAVQVSPPPALQRTATRHVQAGDQAVHIVLQHAARATVRVLDPAGRPVQGALVWASNQDLDAHDVEPLSAVAYGSGNATDVQGAWAIPHLAGNRLYRLRVEPPRGRVELVRQEIQGWSPADTTVRLAAGGSVRGHVRDPAGRPLPEVSLYHRQAGRWQSGNVDREGAFEIGGLDPGEVTLRATTAPDSLETEIDGLPMFTDQRVAVGSRDVTLTVERGRELVVKLEGWPGERGFRKGLLFAEGLLRGRSWTIGSRIEADGSVRFKGLEATGNYVFWLPPEGGDLSALVEGIRADAGSLVVPVTAGVTISGRLVRPEGADAGVVQAFLHNRPFHVQTIPEADGRFVLRGVPRGTRWRVIGACHLGESYRSCEAADVPAGGSVDLTPEAR